MLCCDIENIVVTQFSSHLLRRLSRPRKSVAAKVKNIGFNRYIGTWILLIYWRYIGGYFYMNIDISEINKNTLKFMEILCKSVKMTLIMKYRH